MTGGRIEYRAERDSASATTVVDAEPAAVFDYLRRPANHPSISGDGSVRRVVQGPEVLGPGDSFGMDMRIFVPYRIRNRVVEYEEGRRIAWRHFAGHRWRWEVEPAGEGRSRVTETFDMSTAVLPELLRLAGFPGRHRRNLERSLENLAAHFGGWDRAGAPGG